MNDGLPIFAFLEHIPEIEDRLYVLAQIQGVIPKKSPLICLIRATRAELLATIDGKDDTRATFFIKEQLGELTVKDFI